MEISQIQTLFWDFDGVIVDSTAIKNRAFEKLFAPFGQVMVDKVLDHHLAFGGISRVEKIDHYYREFLNAPLSPEDLAAKCATFSELVVDEVVNASYIPGAIEFIKRYHTTIPMVIVSGTPQEELDEIVKRRALAGYLREVYGSPTKKPERVNGLIERDGLDRNACLFIGDAMTDYNAARDTHIMFVGIRGAKPFPERTIVIPNCQDLEKAISDL